MKQDPGPPFSRDRGFMTGDGERASVPPDSIRVGGGGGGGEAAGGEGVSFSRFMYRLVKAVHE